MRTPLSHQPPGASLRFPAVRATQPHASAWRLISSTVILTCTSLLVGSILPTAHAAGPKVEIVVAEKAAPLEQRAATEVAALLKRLYQAEVTPLASPSGKLPAIFIGSPATNPALDFAKADWPKLSEQGHLVKSTKHGDQPALIIGGGSPAATYWAAQEYAHHLGVRTMLYGDLDPIAASEFSLNVIDLKLEPQSRTRGWKIGYYEPASFAAWSRADQVRFIGQLAKLKYNELVINVRAGEPFIQFEAAGIKRKEGKFWLSTEYPVDGDTAGRSAFGGAKFFDNPDLAKSQNETERIAASQVLLHGVMKAAHDLGMQVTFHIEPYDLPLEYDRHKVFADPELAKECARATVRAYTRTYPEVDALLIGLDDVYPATPSFFADVEIWQRPDRSRIKPKGYANQTREQVKPWLASVPDAHELTYRDLFQIGDKEDESIFHKRDPDASIFDLALAPPSFTDHLPQVTNAQALRKLAGVQRHGWQGFMATATNVGCQDLGAYLLSRNAFGADLTAEQGCDQFLTPVCGAEVHTRVSQALAAAERNTTLSEMQTTIGTLSPKFFMEEYHKPEKAPEWWSGVKDAYLSAMNEMYRANTRAREGSRSYTLYLARQFEFGFEYMNCMQAVRAAGVAKKAGDKEKHVAELEKAIDSINSACNALAAVARTNSDRGTIAFLNVHVYRPLVKELEKADD